MFIGAPSVANHTPPPVASPPARPIQPAAVKTRLTIAGSDSSGGAGVQADLKTFTVLGVFGAEAITAVTAQDTRGARVAEIDAGLVRLQIDMVAQDLGVDATKTGMLPSVAVVEVVRDSIDRNRLALRL